MFRYLALDIETGGIGIDKSLLTAYFAVMDENMLILDELYLYTKPNDGVYSITAEALRINGINLIDHETIAVTYKEAGQNLYSFLSKHSASGQYKLIPLGHNVAFDIKFLCDKLISENSWKQHCSYRVRDCGVLASALMDSGKIPNISGSLGSFLEYFKIKPEGNLHDAKTDALCSAKVYAKMLELLR